MTRFLSPLVAIVLMTSASLTAAEKLGIFASIGYGWGLGGAADIGDYSFASTERNNVGDLTKRDDQYLNGGAGLKIDAGVLWALMDNFYAQIGIEYTAGIPKLERTISDLSEAIGDPDRAYTVSFSRNIFGIKALALPQFRFLDLLDVRTGVGIGIFFCGISVEDSRANRVVEGYIETKPAFAFLGQLGADYPLSEKFILFADLSFTATRFTVEKARDTDGDITIFEKDDIGNDVQTPEKLPGSTWGLRIGIRMPIITTGAASVTPPAANDSFDQSF